MATSHGGPRRPAHQSGSFEHDHHTHSNGLPPQRRRYRWNRRGATDDAQSLIRQRATVPRYGDEIGQTTVGGDVEANADTPLLATESRLARRDPGTNAGEIGRQLRRGPGVATRSGCTGSPAARSAFGRCRLGNSRGFGRLRVDGPPRCGPVPPFGEALWVRCRHLCHRRASCERGERPLGLGLRSIGSDLAQFGDRTGRQLGGDGGVVRRSDLPRRETRLRFGGRLRHAVWGRNFRRQRRCRGRSPTG